MFGFKAISVHKIVSAVAARDYSGNLILNLKGDYPFNGNRINVILDRSANAATVSRAGDGNQQVSSFSPFSGGASYYFDGSGDYLTVARNATFFPTANTDFTIEAWVFLAATPGATNAQIVGAGEYGTDADWVLNINSSLTVQMYVQSTNVTYTGGTVTLNTWNHIAISRSGTASNNFKIFVNGIGTSYSVNNTLVGVGTRALSIGADQNGDESNLTGYISNLRIVNGSAIYAANFTPSTTPLTAVANTSLLTCHALRMFDASTNNFDISVAGNVTASTFAPFDKTALSGTVQSTSVLFDGNGDYLSVPTSTGFDFGTGDFTIECWARRTGAGGGDRFIVSRGNGANFLLRWNSAGVLQFFVNASLVNSYTYEFPIDTWVHIAVARSGSTCKMFINGSEVSSAANSANVSAAANVVLIGGYTSVDFFQGYLSNVRIVKGTAVYTAAFTPPTSSLTAISGTSLLACDGTAITDSSSTNATITVAGDSRLSSLNPFSSNQTIFPGSVYFDGTNDYITIPASTATNILGGDFTVECWFNPISFNASYNLLIVQSTGASGTNQSNFQMDITSAGLARFYSWSTSATSSIWTITATRTVKLGAWNHIAVSHVKSSNTTRLFVNGRLEATGSTATWAGTAIQTCLGNYSSGVNQTSTYAKLNGHMSGVRLIKGSALYTAAFTPPTSPPTATADTALLLNFNDGGTVDAYGSSGAYFITNGGVVSNSVTKKYGTGSLYFPAVSMTAGPHPDYALGTGDFTIECWLNSTNASNGGDAGIMGIYTSAFSAFNPGAPTGALAGIKFGNASGLINFIIGGTQQTGTISVANATWTHIALCRSAGTVRLFVGGVLSKKVDSSANISGQYLAIGCTIGTAYNMTGYLDNFAIYKGYAKYTTDATFTPT